MAKKITPAEPSNDSSVDKLRDELFEYRVDIKSYKKNLNTIIVSGTLIISILAFFGYSKIDNIQDTIMNQANARLAQTDSILAKIDQVRIDSLNQLLLSKEREYNVTIANFERIVRQSMDLQSKLLESLSENERTDGKAKSFTQEYPTNIFTTHPLNKNMKKNHVESIYLVFKDDIEFSKNDYLSIAVYPKGRRILLVDKNYKVSSKFNKMSFAITPFENYQEYEVQISYFKKTGDDYKRHYIIEEINLKQ